MSPQQAKPAADWLGLNDAAKLLNCSPYSVKTMALTGAIRVFSPPGRRVKFCRADVERLAESFPSL